MYTSFPELLSEFAFLLELKSENPFKIKAMQNASRILGDHAKTIKELCASGEITKIPGIGKGTQALAAEFVKTETLAELENLKKEFPPTIFELLGVRGLGPKKIKSLYEELQIASLAELEYACSENRLIDLKGFGAKTQKNILETIAEMKGNQGRVLLPEAEFRAEELEELFTKVKGVKKVHRVGELARSLETISSLDFLLETEKEGKLTDLSFPKNLALTKSNKEAKLVGKSENGLTINLYECAGKESLEEQLFRLSSSLTFFEKTKNKMKDFFWVPPEAREEIFPFTTATKNMPLLEDKNIRGVFHTHTKWSDGANTLEEMVEGCIALGLEYLGVSDHSKTAFYANGLKEDGIKKQKAEIAALQKKYPNFKIFHGIESDILPDGSLDYPESVLEQFDFVIASVHGQMKMNRDDMTKRICCALENPHTTWLGHSTGRLLLGRKGYDIDMDKILHCASKNKKSIELNANPYRLDLDWHYLQKAKELKIPIGIFPDAHSVAGLKDFHYGVKMARKACLTADDICNTLSAKEMTSWLQSRK